MLDLFFFKKSKYSFEDQKSYESVIILLYRHWFTLFVQMVLFAMLGLLPFVLALFFGPTLVQYGLASLFRFVIAIYFLVWWAGLFYRITMYLLDVWIVTDHRILDSEQHGFFDRTVAELNLAKIQDISVEVNGPIATFLDFGSLEIQTAGAEKKFIFKQIPHPRLVKDMIMEAHNEYMRIHKNGIEVHEQAGV